MHSQIWFILAPMMIGLSILTAFVIPEPFQLYYQSSWIAISIAIASFVFSKEQSSITNKKIDELRDLLTKNQDQVKENITPETIPSVKPVTSKSKPRRKYLINPLTIALYILATISIIEFIIIFSDNKIYDLKEFVKSFILVMSPVIVGVIFTPLFGQSWQKTRAKIKMKKEILEGFVNSIKRPIMLIDSFEFQVITTYSDASSVSYNEEVGMSETKVNFPAGADPPVKKLEEEWKKLNQQLADIRFASNLFLTSARLYLRDENLENEYNLIHRKLGHIRQIIQNLVHSTNAQDIVQRHKEYQTQFEPLKKKIKEFEEKLVNSKLKDVPV